jgi:PadR family transcriptional regulator AphA
MSLRAAVLGLLSEGPATGYALARDFDIATSVIWPAPKGEIYRELARLQSDGFAVPDEKVGGRGKRKWHITAKGRAELKRWLRSDSDYTFRYQPLLRAAFLGRLSPDEIAACIKADRRFFESELRKLKQAKAAAPTPQNGRRRFGLPMAILFYEAMIAWCDEADALTRGDLHAR